MKYKIKILNPDDPNYEEKIEFWSIDKILEEINRDHSNEYIPYDEDDWMEGWYEWVERGDEDDYYQLLDKNEKFELRN
tara:strand:+ start:1035 stop:1268 length:234 start_codon:yes stop_codon:yes gene_type:complete